MHAKDIKPEPEEGVWRWLTLVTGVVVILAVAYCFFLATHSTGNVHPPPSVRAPAHSPVRFFI